MSKKISELNALTTPAASDLLVIDDTDATETKKITYTNFIAGFPNNTVPGASIESGYIGAVTHTLSTGATDVTASAAEINNVCDGMAKSTDGTFAANSEAKYPVEKAVKTYTDAKAASAAAAVVSDTAYAASWDGVQTIAPSKNAVYDYLNTLGTAAFLDVGTSASKVVQLDASAKLPGVDGSQLTGISYIYGLGLSHGTDTEHDIAIAAGSCSDSTNAATLILASAITKQADAAWAVGTNAGGMDTGSMPTSGTLHVWLIKRSDTGVVDALFSISATFPTMPAGYDYKRRIGSYRTNASANILNGDWWGTGNRRIFMFDSPILDVDATNPGTSAVTAALSTPGGIITKALVTLGGVGGGSGEQPAAYVSWLSNVDMAPSATNAPLGSMGTISTVAFAFWWSVFTDTSSQIRYRCQNTAAALKMKIVTRGWEDSL